MAAGGARRSLTSGLTLISRRFHPSLSHLLPGPRDRDEPQSQPPPSNPRPFFRSSNPGFYLPLGADAFVRSYSSSSGAASGSGGIGFLKDSAELLPDAGLDAVSAAAAAAPPAPFPGEVAAAAADCYPPVAALQYLIDWVHSVSGTNWWLSIVLTTILIRATTVPLLINQMKTSIKLAELRPEMEAIKAKAGLSADRETWMRVRNELNALFKQHGVTPFTPFKGLFIQGPVFISFFFAISNMVEKVPSMKGGGAFWFTDLTTPDPFYALPILTGLTFFITVELNVQEGMEGNPMAETMKKFSRGLAVLSVPFTASFPKALFCYWITSTLFSLGYGFVLKQAAVRKYFNIPDVVPYPNPASASNFSVFEDMKKLLSTESSEVAGKSPAPVKAPGRRIQSSAVMGQRVRSIERQLKGRNKAKRR